MSQHPTKCSNDKHERSSIGELEVPAKLTVNKLKMQITVNYKASKK